MPWVVKSAFGGVLAYFIGGWVWAFLKFTFWPLFFSVTLGWLYQDLSGATALDEQRAAFQATERAKVVLVSSAFVPKGPYEGHFSKARVSIRNDGLGEGKGIRVHCKVTETGGRLVRREGRDVLVDAEQGFYSERNDLVLPAHQTVNLTLDLPYLPSLRGKVSDLYGCTLDLREFSAQPAIATEEG
jgi:hypothetical protein